VTGSTDAVAEIDALLLQPLISTVAVSGPDGDSTLYVSADVADTQRRIDVPRGQQLVQQSFDAAGQPVELPGAGKGAARSGKVFIAAGGFAQVWFESRK
jgi:F0F1-type ATP synthase beta subunit